MLLEILSTQKKAVVLKYSKPLKLDMHLRR